MQSLLRSNRKMSTVIKKIQITPEVLLKRLMSLITEILTEKERMSTAFINIYRTAKALQTFWPKCSDQSLVHSVVLPFQSVYRISEILSETSVEVFQSKCTINTNCNYTDKTITRNNHSPYLHDSWTPPRPSVKRHTMT